MCATNSGLEDFLDEPQWLKQRKGLVKGLLCDTAASLWVRPDDPLASNNLFSWFYSVYKEYLSAARVWSLALCCECRQHLCCLPSPSAVPFKNWMCFFFCHRSIALNGEGMFFFPSPLCPPLWKDPGNVCLLCDEIGIGYQTLHLNSSERLV